MNSIFACETRLKQVAPRRREWRDFNLGPEYVRDMFLMFSRTMPVRLDQPTAADKRGWYGQTGALGKADGPAGRGVGCPETGHRAGPRRRRERVRFPSPNLRSNAAQPIEKAQFTNRNYFRWGSFCFRWRSSRFPWRSSRSPWRSSRIPLAFMPRQLLAFRRRQAASNRGRRSSAGAWLGALHPLRSATPTARAP